jgi:lysophospholipase L1-like esterase
MRFIATIIFLLAFQRAECAWVATWSASPSQPYSDPAQLNSAHLVFSNQTLREIVHTSMGGDTVRVRLSNVYGSSALEIGAAFVALRTTASGINAASSRPLTFSGRADVIIPPNAILLSDPVSLNVPAATDLVVSLFLPQPSNGAGIHYLATATAYLGAGNQSAAATITKPTSVSYWAFLAGVDVTSDDPAAASVVTFGDSITDGAHSTANANHRWPDYFAANLMAAGLPLSVSNAGISGNRILHDPPVTVTYGESALARLGRDAFEAPGAKYLIILEGINDLGHPGTSSAPLSETVTADDLIAGLKQMADRAHLMGVKVFGCTITPFRGYAGVGYYTDDKDSQREAINAWIRTGESFDAVIDFDLVMRDPDNPSQMLPAYDSGDHLHPGDAGYQAMANAIDLTLFQN